ncbi:MAG: radical SAM protein [Spirochaetales bacterium]|nr:radical SAM protein [Spirochaetales bacterium]
MGFYRLWHDTLGSAGGTHISGNLWLNVLSKPITRLVPFLYTQIIRGRVVNAVSRQIHGSKMFLPKQIIIEPTMKCNIACKECYAPNKNIFMTAQCLEKIIREAMALGISRLVFMGGEPTVEKSFSMIAPFIKKYSNAFFTFCTNGTLITDRLVHAVRGRRNVAFAVSVDGPKSMTDEVRGKGVFDTAMAGIQRLVDADVSVAISLTTRADDWLQQLDSDFIKSVVDRGVVVIYSHFQVKNHRIVLPEIDRLRFLKHLQMLVRKYPIFFNEGYFGKMTPHGIVPRENHQVCIDPEGNVRTDRFEYTPTYGNVLETPLQTILKNPALVAYKRKNRVDANNYLSDIIRPLREKGFRVYQPKILY